MNIQAALSGLREEEEEEENGVWNWEGNTYGADGAGVREEWDLNMIKTCIYDVLNQ